MSLGQSAWGDCRWGGSVARASKQGACWATLLVIYRARNSAPVPTDTVAVTAGDALQAACMLLLDAARGERFVAHLPGEVAGVVIQLPKPPGYFGNANTTIPCSLHGGCLSTPADVVKALQLQAAAIREAVNTFRLDPVCSGACLHSMHD